jgi:hypothetical protein
MTTSKHSVATMGSALGPTTIKNIHSTLWYEQLKQSR